MTQSREILSNIVKVLSGQEKNILEIAKETNIGWETAKLNLEKLEDLGLVIKTEKGKYFAISKKNHKTYFKLPIKEDIIKKVESYYGQIVKLWEKLYNQKPSKLQITKVLAELNKNKNLELPFGWYLYGQCCAVIYNEKLDYVPNSDYEKELLQIIPKYLNNPIKKHYETFPKDSYNLKQEIFAQLWNLQDLRNTKLFEKVKEFMKAILLDKEKISDDALDYTTELLSILYELKANNIEITEEIKDQIDTSFKEIWKLIGYDYFKESFAETIDKNILDACFNNDKEKQKEEIIMQLSMLQSYIENLEIKDSPFEKLKEKINNPEIDKKNTNLKSENEKLFNDFGL
ncbi:MAG: hypothetical protein ACOCXG_05310 [Nanoarchaeota archaeon]